MKRILLIFLVVGLLVFRVPMIAEAIPMYYKFEGIVTSILNQTSSPYQVNIGDKLHFVYMADLEHQAWKITGTEVITYWTDYIYEDFFETTRLSPQYMTDDYHIPYYNDPSVTTETHYGHSFQYPDNSKELSFCSGSESISTAINFDGYAPLLTLNVGATGIFMERGEFRIDGQQVVDEFRGNVILTSISTDDPLNRKIIGDVNGDGVVTLADVILALRISCGIIPSQFISADADVNIDSKIGITEAIYDLQSIARLRNVHFTPFFLFPIGNKTIDESSTLSFTINATDAGNTPLTFSATPLPSGAIFDAGTRTFSWTPAYSQSGTYQVTFTAEDGYGGTASEIINMVVTNKNRVPVLTSIGNKAVNEGATLNFTLSATDEDNDLLRFSATPLPNGATFDAATKTFSWTPTYSQSGNYTVTYTVRDDYGGSDSETVTITVNNKVPVFSAIEYLPLNIGDWQDFKYSSTGVIHRSYTSGPRYIGGVATKERIYWDGQKEYYTSDTNGVKLYGQYVISPDFTGEVYFNSPLLLIPNNAQLGTTQISNSSYTLPVYGKVYHVDITSTVTILGLEDVKTANMTLKDCVKASVRFDEYLEELDEYFPGDTVYYWFYKGVGCVKQVEGSDTYIITGSYINGVEKTY